jgi:hypothetical protein
MIRFLCCATVVLSCSTCFARPVARPTAYDDIIARQAKVHGIPESFVHRIVIRESGYNPRLVHHHCYGLMQIKYATARGMGYRGDPRGDPETNLTYAIPYLANAYRLADGDESRATALFRSGYYYAAKRKKLLGALWTASAPPLMPAPAPPEPPRSSFSGPFSFLAGPHSAAAAHAAQSRSKWPRLWQPFRSFLPFNAAYTTNASISRRTTST